MAEAAAKALAHPVAGGGVGYEVKPSDLNIKIDMLNHLPNDHYNNNVWPPEKVTTHMPNEFQMFRRSGRDPSES